MTGRSTLEARIRAGLTLAIAAFVFGCAWLLRFNDPGGSFAGLTDDHFFYIVRAWQILFGDLPVRDFVDQGAPLFYYVGAGVQMLFGRGTLPELMFCITVLAFCAAATYWLGASASGSVLAGLLGAAFQLYLGPRFYNYPKILVYVLAIPVLWKFAETPNAKWRFWLAVVTVVGFLFRHDHGVYVAVAVFVLLALMQGMPWWDRLKHAAAYLAICVGLLAPYALFVQMNGGVFSYAQQVASWAERERERTPPEWPGLFDNPDGVSDAARDGWPIARAIASVQDNDIAWTYYFEIVLPIFALVLLALSPDGLRPGWPRAREKLAAVAVLALVLDLGFLRSPLEARLADPSVPHSVLLSWLVVALPRFLFTRQGRTARVATAIAAVALAFVLWSVMSEDIYRKLARVNFTDGLDSSLQRADSVARQVRRDWALETWKGREAESGLIGLSLYVNACTEPNDRVFVQAYMPQVLGMARRGFAGGHADLRPGFFETEDAQRLTLERLARQSVPILLLETGDAYRNFRKSFPLITEHFDKNYEQAGTLEFDGGRFGTAIFVRRDLTPRGVYEPYKLPCFGSGKLQS